MMDLDQAERRMPVEATALDWFALYSAVLLALKHPAVASMDGTRRMLVQWIATLEFVLVDSRLLARADLAQMHAGVDVVARDEVR